MLEIFRRGGDIHRATAAKIHNLPEAKVTAAIRSTAKEVNFGVIYGMGAWGLAARTGLNRDEARDFIARYFETFAGVKRYLDETLANARALGYVETLFGRRRWLPELKSSMLQVRAQAERMAVNMPIQGTAADLIKLAMVRVHAGLGRVSAAARLILQVHDELVLEVPARDLVAVAVFVRDVMETVTKLEAPIEVHLKAGQSWGTMKPLRLNS
jgi:DNA polymerase-1